MTDLRALIEALLNAAPPGAKYIELDDVRALLADVPPAHAVDEAMRVDTVVQHAAEESVVPLKQQLRWAVHNGASWADSSLHAESADALDERDATIARLEAAIKHVCEECPGVPCSKHRTPQYVLEMAAALQRVEALCVDDPTGEFACMVDKRE